MIKPIKSNIGLWISSEPSPENLTNCLKFCWLKVTCCICQSSELEREIEQKTRGDKQGASQKSGRGHGPSSPPPIRTATVALSLLCDLRYSTMEKLSWEFFIHC